VNIASKFAGPLSSRHSLYTDDLSLFCVLPSPLEPPASPISVYYRAFPLRFFFRSFLCPFHRLSVIVTPLLSSEVPGRTCPLSISSTKPLYLAPKSTLSQPILVILTAQLDFEQSILTQVQDVLTSSRAATLDSVMYRSGLLAALRSKAKQGQVIGVMITASHNPAEVR
jgi:hypothetical protein